MFFFPKSTVPSTDPTQNSSNPTPPASTSFYQRWYPINDFIYQVGVGTALYPLQITASTVALNIEHKYFLKPTLTIHQNYQQIADLLKESRTARMHIRFIGPALEEIMFRGALMPAMRYGLEKKLNIEKNTATLISIVGSSFIFAALHGPGARFSNFATGLAYSAITIACDDSLVPATVAHMINNSVALHRLSMFVAKKPLAISKPPIDNIISPPKP